MKLIKPINQSTAKISISTKKGVIFSTKLAFLLDAHFCPDAYHWPEAIGDIQFKLEDEGKTIAESTIPLEKWITKWHR